MACSGERPGDDLQNIPRTHKGELFGIPPTGRKIQFETVDVMRVRDGKITEHWGVDNLFSLMQQLGALPSARKA